MQTGITTQRGSGIAVTALSIGYADGKTAVAAGVMYSDDINHQVVVNALTQGLYSHIGILSIDWDGMKAYNWGSNTLSIDWGQRHLVDANGDVVYDWSVKQAHNYNNYLFADVIAPATGVETTLAQLNVPINSLSTAKGADTIMELSVVGVAVALAQVRFYFGPNGNNTDTLIGDSTSGAFAVSTESINYITLIPDGSGNVRIILDGIAKSGTLLNLKTYTVAALNNAVANFITMTGVSNSAGQLTFRMGKIVFNT